MCSDLAKKDKRVLVSLNHLYTTTDKCPNMYFSNCLILRLYPFWYMAQIYGDLKDMIFWSSAELCLQEVYVC